MVACCCTRKLGNYAAACLTTMPLPPYRNSELLGLCDKQAHYLFGRRVLAQRLKTIFFERNVLPCLAPLLCLKRFCVGRRALGCQTWLLDSRFWPSIS